MLCRLPSLPQENCDGGLRLTFGAVEMNYHAGEPLSRRHGHEKAALRAVVEVVANGELTMAP